MNKLNQLLLTILLVISIIAIPYLLLLITFEHDAKMCANMIKCQAAYKTYSAYSSCVAPYRQRMIFAPKTDATIIEKQFNKEK